MQVLSLPGDTRHTFNSQLTFRSRANLFVTQIFKQPRMARSV